MAHLYDCPIKTSIYKGCSMAMLNNQRVWLDNIIIPTNESSLINGD